ncbi:DUF3710 domain-containing protein [Blastococcus sp. TML/M2B]|uniref:DUF3710 domain-containing protein n=1 Tax=unclassified Blastococcus TaxID=2619396 RepID=UPI00190967E3|nr:MULTISPECIES: DUF3710 domain-containing protein [unclassified Blastococcus]MBN1093175.1 DUF3710 domain-containing protein [Blastococcus sp. TML/M2B]MBN1096710.1 DUF3710 domain-containing protein [Blastococcus sp. TML/C7B]
MPFGRRRNRIDRSLRERGVPPEPQVRERDVQATSGPWDVTDAPDDGLPRLDLGALRLPARPGMELRVDLNPQGQVVGATLRSGDSLLQVAAFAAPRAAGIWDDVRQEIATTASGQGASLREVDGPFGRELAGTVVAAPPAQPGQPAPEPTRRAARFLGVDGPRWFLRGTMSGSAAEGPEAAAALEEAFRAIVVVRGSEPMPVREALPLTLPAEAAARVAAQQQAAAGGAAATPPRTPPAGGSGAAAPAPGRTTLEP